MRFFLKELKFALETDQFVFKIELKQDCIERPPRGADKTIAASKSFCPALRNICIMFGLLV